MQNNFPVKQNKQSDKESSSPFFSEEKSQSEHFFSPSDAKETFFKPSAASIGTAAQTKKADKVQEKSDSDKEGVESSEWSSNDLIPLSIQQKEAKGATVDSVSVAQKRDVTLPEQLGPAQQGDIANKGEGDGHAFSPTDVNQGSIGDCYFLASLIAVSKTNPNLIKNAIDDNGNGTYTVKLFTVTEEKGLLWGTNKVFTPTKITLYPTFPMAVNGKDGANPNANANPAHAHGGNVNAKGETELWVRLIEKAYALLLGSYSAIGKGGLGANALEALTGKPYKEKTMSNDLPGRKKRIIAMVKKGYPVEVATNKVSINTMSDDDKKFAQENSIVIGGNHSYAVMAANKDSITLRNPWGSGARNAEPTLTWAQFDAMFWQFSDRE